MSFKSRNRIIRNLLGSLAGLTCLFAFAACEAVDDGPADEAGIAVDEAEQAILANVYKGTIAYRATKAGTLTSGDRSHYYNYTATAGQTVTFALEWTLPASANRGAMIQLYNNTGVTKLAEHYDPLANQAHITYTFAAAGTYRIYAKHVIPALSGSFPYKLGAQPDLCVVWDGTMPDAESLTVPPVVNLLYMMNFPELAAPDPWSYDPGFGGDPDFTITSRVVRFGNCNAQHNYSCGTAGPTAFVTEFPDGIPILLPNACQVRNRAFDGSGTTSGWMLFWQYCSMYPGVC